MTLPYEEHQEPTSPTPQDTRLAAIHMLIKFYKATQQPTDPLDPKTVLPSVGDLIIDAAELEEYILRGMGSGGEDEESEEDGGAEEPV